MGTRGLIGFKINDGYIGVAYTGDAYPSNIGKYLVVNFLRTLNKKKLKRFKHKIAKLNTPVKDYIPLANHYICICGVHNPYNRNNRKIESIDLLKEIFEGKITFFHNEINFIKDSVFCEYAYIINLDDFTLDCYMGGEYQCSKIQKGNPFNYSESEFCIRKINMYWYPCKQIARFNLLNIPEKWEKVFALGYNGKPRIRKTINK